MKFILFLAFALGLALAQKPLAENDEERLINTLLKGYTKMARPVSSPSDTVNVNATLNVLRVMKVQKCGNVAATFLMTVVWKDPRLAWDPEEYGNITRVVLPGSEMWRPDLFVFDVNTEGFHKFLNKDSKATVCPCGTVTYKGVTGVKPECTGCPHSDDGMNCSFPVGSWAYTPEFVKLSSQGSKDDVLVNYGNPDYNVTMNALGIDKYHCAGVVVEQVKAEFNIKAERCEGCDKGEDDDEDDDDDEDKEDKKKSDGDDDDDNMDEDDEDDEDDDDDQ